MPWFLGFWSRHKPQNKHYLSLETSGHLKKKTINPWGIFGNNNFANPVTIIVSFMKVYAALFVCFVLCACFFLMLITSRFIKMGEDADRRMIQTCWMEPQKPWMWISYLSKTWNSILINRTKFSIFKWGNPQHPSPYRLPNPQKSENIRLSI